MRKLVFLGSLVSGRFRVIMLISESVAPIHECRRCKESESEMRM